MGGERDARGPPGRSGGSLTSGLAKALTKAGSRHKKRVSERGGLGRRLKKGNEEEYEVSETCSRVDAMRKKGGGVVIENGLP